MLLLISLISLVTADLHPSGQTEPLAVCITEPASLVAPEPPRWHALMPAVVLGLDVETFGNSNFDANQTLLLVEPRGVTGESSIQRHDQRRVTRWTIGLRWTSPSAVSTRLTPTATTPVAELCTELFTLRGQRPGDLETAIDHWSRWSSIQALLANHLREVRHD